jgi:hypothetical protein
MTIYSDIFSITSNPAVPTTFTEDVGTATPVANNLNILGGPGIATSGSGNTVTISATGAGFTWTDVTGATQTISVENGYICDRGGGVTFTLPATASVGNEFAIAGKLGLWTIAQNANQQMLLGSSSSTVGVAGSFTATNVGDCIQFVCITGGASTIWRAVSVIGNPTIA